jgi:hypothetical protein
MLLILPMVGCCCSFIEFRTVTYWIPRQLFAVFFSSYLPPIIALKPDRINSTDKLYNCLSNWENSTF